jgi:hypothetical protein
LPELTTIPLGLSTPRLKRLTDIVNAQAIAQQERAEAELLGGDDEAAAETEAEHGLGITSLNGAESNDHDHPISKPDNEVAT